MLQLPLVPVCRIEKADAVTWLRSLPHSSVDLVVTDCAYESLEKHRRVGTTTRLSHSDRSSNDWFPIFKNERFEELFKEFYRVMVKNSHFYFHCDAKTMFVAKPVAEEVGFKFWNVLVWDKQKMGMGYHYRHQTEFVLFFEKGKRKLNSLSVCDLLPFPNSQREYPTQKPVPLETVFIEQSSALGELVCDPFVGSGTTAVAALSCGRKFIGCDVKRKAVDLALKRTAALAS